MGIVTVRMGEPLYEQLLAPIRADRELLDLMWSEAESRDLDERPGAVWHIAIVGDEAAAWIAADLEDGALRLRNHYERPGFRDRGLYAALVEHVHGLVEASGLPAHTYVFETPMLALTALGWTSTDEGDSNELDAPSHHWWRVEWTPAASR